MKKLIRFLWSLLPRFLRRSILNALQIFLSRPLPRDRVLGKGDVVIGGLLGTASGLGHGARLMMDALRGYGLTVYGANASRFAILEDFDAGPLWPEQASKGGIAIFHINPDILGLVVNAIGRQRFLGRRVVGYWAWELEAAPPDWKRAVSLVDEIWTPSVFVADAMRKIAGGKPIHVVPQPFDVKSVPTVPKEDPLPALKGKTVVFFMYDVRSCHARKNPEAVVAAFRKAAANDDNAVLVIKINNNHVWPEAEARIRTAAQGMTNLVIMHDKLSPEGMKDLMARVDIVMSLHRCEGFGLLMAEAMTAGKPIIATGWSANLDFMTAESSLLIDAKLIPIVDPQHAYDKYGGRWADPDVDQAAAALKRLLDDKDYRLSLGQAARKQAEKFFSVESWRASLPQSFWDSVG